MPLLAGLLPSYAMDTSAKLTQLTVSENHTYCADDGDRQLVLRVHRAGYHTQTEILSELDWIAALHNAETVVTAQPIARADGGRLSFIALNGQQHCVSAFSFLEGQEPKVGHHLTSRFEELGAINARLHQHAKDWPRPPSFARKRWDFDLMFGPQPIWGDWRAAYEGNEDIVMLERLEARLRSKLDAYGDDPGRFGLIHGDLRVANLLDDGDRLAVIDFDDCGFSWFAYDFAAAISFHEEEEAVPALQAAWLKGYRSIASFGAEDETILPTMIMARRLLLTAWLASRAGNDTDALYGRGFAEGTLRLAKDYLG
jgi:Ser/Thr protein kinase RdoA (MazF antagonist)